MKAQPEGSRMLRCVLIARDGSEVVITAPSLSLELPARIRVPSHWEHTAAFDVFQFTRMRGAEAVYEFVATIPCSTDELGTSDIGELGPYLPE